MGGKVIEVTSKTEWDAQLSQARNAGRVVIVDFTATWCGPCQMIGPEFVRLSDKYPQITFLKVDVDAVSDVAAVCNVSAMPTFQVFKDGAKVDELIGASKDKLAAICEKYA